MSLNKYGFQLVIIAEDDNLLDVAQGFHEGMDGNRRIHVEPVEGKRRSHHGWLGAVNSLVNYNLPGHGGVMDRFDSVVFIAPMVLVALSVYTMLR